MLRASALLPQPLGPEIPMIRGRWEEGERGGQGVQGCKWHVRTQLRMRGKGHTQRSLAGHKPTQAMPTHTLTLCSRTRHIFCTKSTADERK